LLPLSQELFQLVREEVAERMAVWGIGRSLGVASVLLHEVIREVTLGGVGIFVSTGGKSTSDCIIMALLLIDAALLFICFLLLERCVLLEISVFW
jgi:hypothetical protein